LVVLLADAISYQRVTQTSRTAKLSVSSSDMFYQVIEKQSQKSILPGALK